MKCFYHYDLDGKCAGSIVAKYEDNYDPSNYFMVDYVQKIPVENISNNEKVYFVDYSFTENTKNVLYELIDKKCDIVWIDHHTSSINLVKSNPELENINGIRLEGISGAALTYMYLYDKKFDELPYYVKLVSDYDCWKYDFEPDTTMFKLGMDSINHDALENIWKFFDYESNHKLEYPVERYLNDIINRGRTIKEYIEYDNIMYRDSYGYESSISGYRCFVVNKKTNSWIFGELYEKYPLVAVWVFNGEKYQYSLYSSKEDVDCSKIAESYGGGGHKGAAGFTHNDLLLKKI